MSGQRGRQSEAEKERFVDELVYGRPPMGIDDIRKSLHSLGLRSNPTFVICLALSGFGHLGIPRRKAVRTKALSALRKIFPDPRRNMIAFLHENSFYVFGCSRKTEKSILGAKAARAVRTIAGTSGLRATAGISTVPNPEGLRAAATGAVVARRYEFIGFTQDVFWHEDIECLPRSPSLVYSESEEELASTVRIGDVSRTSKIALETAEKIITDRLGVMAEIRVEILGMVLVASRAALQGGVAAEKVMRVNADCLRRITDTHDLDEMAETAAGTARDFAEMVHELHREKRAPAVERAKECIRKNFADKITLEGLARASFSSPYHLSRLFKSQEGMSFVDFLNSVRVEEARRLLSDPGRTVTSVCFDTGFNSLDHFTRTFKKIVGKTPSAYRKSASQ